MEVEVRTRPQRKWDSPILREPFETDDEQEDNEENDEIEEDSESEEVAPKKRKRSNENSRAKKRVKSPGPPGLPLAVAKSRVTGRKRETFQFHNGTLISLRLLPTSETLPRPPLLLLLVCKPRAPSSTLVSRRRVCSLKRGSTHYVSPHTFLNGSQSPHMRLIPSGLIPSANHIQGVGESAFGVIELFQLTHFTSWCRATVRREKREERYDWLLA